MLKLFLFIVLAYAVYKFLRMMSGFFDKKQDDGNLKQNGNGQSKIKKEDIIEADFEEIESNKNDEKNS